MAASNDGLLDTRVMAPKLSDAERKLRDQFVQEYLKDGSAYNATLRIGYMDSVAHTYAQFFMNCSYVQMQISECMYAPNDKHDNKSAEALIKNTMAQVMMSGKNIEKVAAAKLFASVFGLVKPVQPQSQGTGVSSGVVLLPEIASLDDWEAMALASQSALVEDTKNL